MGLIGGQDQLLTKTRAVFRRHLVLKAFQNVSLVARDDGLQISSNSQFDQTGAH